jgi:hypothetical protein
MKRIVKIVLRNCWFGIAYLLIAVPGSMIYALNYGALWGLNAPALAFAILVIGIMALAGLVAFFRQPNPYGRLYARYELMDLPEHHDELDSGGSGWIWQAAPMAIAALILLPFFA